MCYVILEIKNVEIYINNEKKDIIKMLFLFFVLFSGDRNNKVFVILVIKYMYMFLCVLYSITADLVFFQVKVLKNVNIFTLCM
jgi:hypothetical protein